MRPVRFVALSEDGHALVLTDEVGRLLALPIDERVHYALRPDNERTPGSSPIGIHSEAPATLAPRDIQARIRSGESAEDVARVAGVPVDRVLRYAGPVLQERAMLAQYARRTKLRTSERGSTLAEVVDGRLAQHGIDTEKISWDASRREDGTWRIVATSRAASHGAGHVELDKARQVVTPFDDMARYLHRPHGAAGPEFTERHGHGPCRAGRASRAAANSGRGEHNRGDVTVATSGAVATTTRCPGLDGPTRATAAGTTGGRPGSGPTRRAAFAAGPAAGHRAGRVPRRRRQVAGATGPVGPRRRGRAHGLDRRVGVRRAGRAGQGRAVGAVARGAAPTAHGRRRRGHRQAAQAAAELGRRALRRRPGPRVRLTSDPARRWPIPPG
jgi:hypothetical protein